MSYVYYFQKAKENNLDEYKLLKEYFVFHTNSLAGFCFLETEAASLINNDMVCGEHSVMDVLEYYNSIELFDYIINTLGCAINIKFINALHSKLFKGTIYEQYGHFGCFKKRLMPIKGYNTIVTHPKNVKKEAESLLIGWHKSDKTLEDIAKFHSIFEQIHPYQDGNGRIGRYIMLKQCIESGLAPVVISENENNRYNHAMYEAQKHNKFDDLQKFFQSQSIEIENIKKEVMSWKRGNYLERNKPQVPYYNIKSKIIQSCCLGAKNKKIKQY